MKRFFAVALLAVPLSFACATAAHAMGNDKDKDKDRKPGKNDKDRGGQTVAAPEIDGAAGTLAIALAGGGLALLSRSRRKRD